MCDPSEAMLETIKMLWSLDWSSIITAICSLWMALIATIALKQWKKPSKAEREIAFLNDLTDSVHDFIERFSAPIEMTRFIFWV